MGCGEVPDLLARGSPAGFGGPYETLVARREAREPMAYILGHQEFWGRPFTVTPDVLIPRPETELIVETALELFPDRQAALRIADVGTGSGCLAVTLAAEFPGAVVVATDTSRRALAAAEHNAGPSASPIASRSSSADVLAGVSGPFDLVVSNPPYIPDSDRPGLPPEVVGNTSRRRRSSAAPTVSPSCGASFIDAARSLAPSGWLLVEFGLGQADQMTRVDLRDARAHNGRPEARPAGHSEDGGRARLGDARMMSNCLFCKIVNRDIPAGHRLRRRPRARVQRHQPAGADPRAGHPQAPHRVAERHRARTTMP